MSAALFNRSFVLLLLTLFIPGLHLISHAEEDAVPEKPLVEFHSGFWINLHHFLYTQARSALPRKGAREPLLVSADSDERSRLSPAEHTDWDKTIAYYDSSLATRDLLFDDGMVAIKNALEDAETSPDLAQVKIPQELKNELLRAAPIYRAHWWARHNAQNHAWIAQLDPLVARYGAAIAQVLVRIYEEPWPHYPVRVDAVVYANWAGAYTTLEPTRPPSPLQTPPIKAPRHSRFCFTSHRTAWSTRRGMR
jgi:hypothetical protein